MLWPKKNSYKESDKKFLRLENSPSPPPAPTITFLMVRPLKITYFMTIKFNAQKSLNN